jgi:hypothetical protein
MKAKKSPHPGWALKCRKPGTELRKINNRYYLYEVTSKWDPKKKRSRKVTGKIIGSITEKEGLIPSEKRSLREKVMKPIEIKSVSTKEYGASHFLIEEGSAMVDALEKVFPRKGKLIFSIAFIRLMYQSPIKNMGIYANESFIGDFCACRIDDKLVSQLLRNIGSDRSPLTDYMKHFINGKDQILIDMTHMITYSKEMLLPKVGYKKPMDYKPQVNLIYIFSSTQQSPSYYRLVPGNIKEVKAFALSLKESGIKDAIIIGDKGFFSEKNIKEIRQEKLQHIIPLRRSSSLIDYAPIDEPNKKAMDGFFEFEKRFIWYYSYERNGLQVISFLDEQLKLSEQNDYLRRLNENKKGYTLEGFRNKQKGFGTLTMVHNLTDKAQDIYISYKGRVNIETMFDAGKNILQLDVSYMQNEHALEGWLFIHHIALQLYYKIYSRLKNSNLLSKYSVTDMLLFLSTVRKIKINDIWYLSEITKPTQLLLEKLNLHIT